MMDAPSWDSLLKHIKSLEKEMFEKFEKIKIVVFLLGGGPERPINECLSLYCANCDKVEKCKFKKRLELAKFIFDELKQIPIIFDIIKSEFVDIFEEETIMTERYYVIIIFPESPGSISEFVQLSQKAVIAPKIRLLIPIQFHPLYSKKLSFTSQRYHTFLAQYGYVYPYLVMDPDIKNLSSLSDLKLIVRRLIEAEQKRLYLQQKQKL